MNWPHPKTAGTVARYARGAQAPAAGMVQRARARRGKVATARCAVRTWQRDVPTYKLSFTANMAVSH